MDYTFTHAVSGRLSSPSPEGVVNYQAKDVVTGKTLLVCMGILFGLALAVAVISCSICFHVIRRRLRKSKSRRASAEILDIPDPFTSVQTKTSEGVSYSGLDVVAQQLQLDSCPDLASTDEKLGDHKGLCHVQSLDDLLNCDEETEYTSARWSKRSQSLAVLDLGSLDPNLRFSLNFKLASSTLFVTVHEVTKLPFKFRGRGVSVSVYLYPSDTEGATTQLSVYTESARFEHQFKFSDITVDDLEKCTLRFCVSSRKLKKTVKETFVGQVYLKGSDVTWMPPRQQEFSMKLERKQLKKDSTSEKYLFHGLGEILILLQYQQSANRIKVLVLKAADLPRSDKLVGQPAHYVVIKMLEDGEMIDQQETTPQSGNAPTWNQPFLFDTSSADMDSLSFEFIIMRDRRYKDSVVGHVTIGPEKASKNKGHWEEILNPYRREVSKWHNVMPVLKFE